METLRVGTKLQEIGREWVELHASTKDLSFSSLTRYRGRRLAADADVDGEP